MGRDRAVLTCHSVSPGGTSPAQSLFHQRWSGKAQTPAKKQKAGAEGESSAPEQADNVSPPHPPAETCQTGPELLVAAGSMDAAETDPSSSGHSCLHSGIYISAHPTKCNSCLGAFGIPPTHNSIGKAPMSPPGSSPSQEMELHVLSPFLGPSHPSLVE